MKQKHILALGAALAAGIFVTSASGGGHSDASAAAIKARQAQMSLIAFNMGVLGGMAKGEVEFDQARATGAAKSLAHVAKLDPSLLWVEGTIQGEVPGTRAKAEIWSDAAGFAKAGQALADAADGLAASSGLDGLRAAMGAAGDACSTCHKSYRGPKN